MTIADTRTTEPRLTSRQHWNNNVKIHAMMRGDADAIRFQGVGRSWRDLHDRNVRLAAAMSESGVGYGDRVLIVTMNRIEFVEAVLAINAIGAIAVPVNFRMAPPEVAYLVADTGSAAIVYEAIFDPLIDALDGSGAVVPLAIRIEGPRDRSVGYEALIARDRELAPVDVPESAPALIMYTSGTTGRPKGAVLTHANMHAQAINNLLAPGEVDHDAVGSVAVPMFHIAAVGVLASSLLDGITTVVFPLTAFDPAATLDIAAAERVTTMFMVPAQWQMVVLEQQARPRDLALKFIWWGAAPASSTLLEALSRTFPEATICAVFGQTEMSPVTCVLAGAETLRKVGSIGRVIRTVAARVVDSEMNDVPVGEVGEIVYRGPNMMSGYWNSPEATDKAFEGGWFHSGDLVRQDDEGYLYVVDRCKDMIISGGENIYCVEVENAVAAHPRVLEAAVVGRSDPKWGEVCVAVVQLRPDSDAGLTVDELAEFLNGRIARYKHPRDVIVVDVLPRNTAGKVAKAALREKYGTGHLV